MFTTHPIRHVRMTGLLLALYLGAGLGEARAGLGIEILMPPVLSPVEDPLTQYDFKLLLVAGNQVLQNDFITLLDIPSYDGISRYVFTSGGVDYSQLFSIRASEGSAPGLTNIQLILTGAPGTLTNADPVNDLPIGDLIIETSVMYPPPADSPLFNPISYMTQTHLVANGALNVGSGTAPGAVLVPEPSSLALLGLGGASLAVLARRRGRRQGRSA